MSVRKSEDNLCVVGEGVINQEKARGCFFNQGGQARTRAPSSWKTDEIFGYRVLVNPNYAGREEQLGARWYLMSVCMRQHPQPRDPEPEYNI